MRNQKVLAIVILSMVLWVSSLNAASFQGLGVLPGGGYKSYAYGVSSDGSVVVGDSILLPIEFSRFQAA